MTGPPERKSPAGRPGSENRLVRGEIQDGTYGEWVGLASVRCSECAFFHAYTDANQSNQGECRAQPPRFIQSGLESGAWPRIAAFEWCGAFERRAEQ